MNKKHFYPTVILLLCLPIGIQTTRAIDIPTDTSVGTWDGSTYTLTTNVSEGLVIVQSNMILDGAGHEIIGAGSGNGILLSGKTGVTIKNLIVTGFVIGIRLSNNSYENALIYNTIENNQFGIYLDSSNYNTLSGNTVRNHTYSGSEGIGLHSAQNNTINGNTIRNNCNGIVLMGHTYNNQVYNNNFLFNEYQTVAWIGIDVDDKNVFNLELPIGGNHWHNWTSPDTTPHDGIVDDPYPIIHYPAPPADPTLHIHDNLPWVDPDGWPNQPPVANAGPDKEVECACQTLGGTIQVTLNGNGSYDPDRDPLTSYSWTGSFPESPASGATPTVTLNGYPGDYVIDLVVNDGELDSAPDTVVITLVDTTPPEITCPGDIQIVDQGPDGVPAEDEQIQTFLAGASATDNCDPEPTITNDAPDFFPPGDTVVTFTATDESSNSSSCSSTVTVMEVATNLRIIPPVINRDGRLRRILAVLRFPEGVTEEDIDIGQPLILYPGDSPDGIEATSQRIVTRSRGGTLSVNISASFAKDAVTAAIPEDGQVEMMVIGRFMSGQYFYGIDTARIN